MSMFNGLTRFAQSRRKARAQRRTELLLDSLPANVQKDIGWRWSPTSLAPQASAILGLDNS